MRLVAGGRVWSARARRLRLAPAAVWCRVRRLSLGSLCVWTGLARSLRSVPLRRTHTRVPFRPPRSQRVCRGESSAPLPPMLRACGDRGGAALARRRLPGLSCEAPCSVSRAAGVAVGAAGGCILRSLCPATALGREPTPPHPSRVSGAAHGQGGAQGRGSVAETPRDVFQAGTPGTALNLSPLS